MYSGATALQSQYLTFLVGEEEFGIGILQAKEIIEYDVITTVPNAPAFIRGVINLRGTVVPVVDLAVKFGRESSTLTRRSCIVVVEVDGAQGPFLMGVLADRVSQVVDLPQDSIEPPPEFGTGVRADWLVGLGRTDRAFILLLDVEGVLTGVERTRVEQTATAPVTEPSAA